MPCKRNKIIAKLLSNPSVAAMPEDEQKNTYSKNNHLAQPVISCSVVFSCRKSIDMDHNQPTEFSRKEILVDILKPVLHFTALSGQELYPLGYLSKRQQCLCKVFKCIILLFLILNIMRLYLIFDINATQGKLIVYLNFMLFYSIEVFKHGVKFLFNIVYGRRLLEKFTAYFPLTEERYLRKLKQNAKSLVKISAFIIILSITILTTILSTTEFIKSTVGDLLQISICENVTFEIINHIFFSWFVASGILSNDNLLYLLVKIICCELHALSQKLKVLDDQEETVSDIQEQTVISKFIQLQKKYEEIMDLLHQVNTYFAVSIVLTFLLEILVTCMLIYVTFQPDVADDEKMVITSMTISQALLAISILYNGISIQVAVCLFPYIFVIMCAVLPYIYTHKCTHFSRNV